MVIGNLAFTNHHVVRQHTAHGFMEAATDRFLGTLKSVQVEVRPAVSSPSAFSTK